MLRGQHATLDHEREQAGLVARTLEQIQPRAPGPSSRRSARPGTMVAARVRADRRPLI